MESDNAELTAWPPIPVVYDFCICAVFQAITMLAIKLNASATAGISSSCLAWWFEGLRAALCISLKAKIVGRQ
jgi:hypothetical protein